MEPGSPSLLGQLRREGKKKKKWRSGAGQDEGEERHPRRDAKLHFNPGEIREKRQKAVRSYQSVSLNIKTVPLYLIVY